MTINEGGLPIAFCVKCHRAFYRLEISRGRRLIKRIELHHRKFHGREQKLSLLFLKR